MSDAAAIRVENHRITTRDKTPLSATLYRPQKHNNHTILIASAMGMPQRFYRHYANFLAEQGCVVLSFDYRSIAASKQHESLWAYEAHITQWAAQDLQAIIKWLKRQYPEASLTLIGHSLGGLLPGGASHNHHVNAIIGVSAANICWRNWAWWQQPGLLLFWYLILPILSHAMGYFPSSWFGWGEAVPKGIALDWAKAGLHRQGIKGLFLNTDDDAYASFNGYARFYSFADDYMMAPKKAVDAVLTYYPNAIQSQRRHISPESIGMDRIGHNRFFRPEMRETLWQESLNWILNPALEIGTVPNNENASLQAASLPLPS